MYMYMYARRVVCHRSGRILALMISFGSRNSFRGPIGGRTWTYSSSGDLLYNMHALADAQQVILAIMKDHTW